MKKLALALLITSTLGAQAQVAGWPPPAGAVAFLCVYNLAPPTLSTTNVGFAQCDSTGSVRITGTVSATVTPGNAIGITPTDRTVTSATGASQTVMAANASRKSLTLVNTGTANCGVNPTGGTAAIGGAGTITIVPFGSYTPRVPTLAAVTAICTAGQPLYADEG